MYIYVTFFAFLLVDFLENLFWIFFCLYSRLSRYLLHYGTILNFFVSFIFCLKR